MCNQVRVRLALFLAAYAGMITLSGVWAQDSRPKEAAKPQNDRTTGKATAATVPVKPKPLSEQVNKGLAFLVRQQHANGGWSQGEESTQMGNSGDRVKDLPNVADTCMATLALLRAGNTPKAGIYADNVLKAIDFVCKQVDKADKDSLYVTDVRGTRVQSKLGPYVDTFTVSLLFAELKGKMPDEKSEKRLVAALDKAIAKIHKNQRQDGTWANEGWAPILSQAIASKGLNRAAQNGFQVGCPSHFVSAGFGREIMRGQTGRAQPHRRGVVDLVDGRPEVLGIEVGAVVAPAVEHAHDVRGLVVDDGAALLVPQHRHAHAPGETRIGDQIDIGQRAGRPRTCRRSAWRLASSGRSILSCWAM